MPPFFSSASMASFSRGQVSQPMACSARAPAASGHEGVTSEEVAPTGGFGACIGACKNARGYPCLHRLAQPTG